MDNKTCRDGGTRHSWWSDGLDVVKGQLRRVSHCVWCARERNQAPR